MSDPHATTDQLADLLEGALADEQAEAVGTHLAGCASCASVRDQLNALPALLAATTVPPMPTAVASRLDAVVAAESARRQAQQEPPETAVVVVPLRRLRRDRARHWFAGAVSAAAVLVAISVVPDLLAGPGSGEAADSGAGGGAAGAVADAERQAPEAAAGRSDVPDLDSGRFASGVTLLHDSGAAAYRVLGSVRGRTGTVDGQAQDDATGLGAGERAFGTACASDALSAASVSGAAGPLVRVDGELARLVTSGPAAVRTVEAYSCGTGSLLAAAVIDLSR